MGIKERGLCVIFVNIKYAVCILNMLFEQVKGSLQ